MRTLVRQVQCSWLLSNTIQVPNNLLHVSLHHLVVLFLSLHE
uniref:Uncharacterized protein n=1 Tax=Arundo donax TaxID=35708 RepID=A0A0A9ADN7_ARUDO